MNYLYEFISTNFLVTLILSVRECVHSVQIPGSCTREQFYDTGLLACQPCPANASMVASTDGFSCTCMEHSIPMSASECKPCDVTEMVSADGRRCVPRRCQTNAGRRVCRKCPNDYISVTQNFDGSPMKEVQCVKCARGYRAEGDVCVLCEHCACAKHEQAVSGVCVPKRFVSERTKVGTAPTEVIRHEYLCTKNNVRACRALANMCVKSFYSFDLGGPCRLWVLTKTTVPKGLPPLTVDLGSSEKVPGEITVTKGMNTTVTLAAALHFSSGELEILQNINQKQISCHLPITFTLGQDFSKDCWVNLTRLYSSNVTIAPYMYVDGDFIPLPVKLRKPDGEYVQRGTWPNSKFQRYFYVHEAASSIPNVTSSVYLRTLLIKVRIERENYKSALRMFVSLETQYGTKQSQSLGVTTLLAVEHDMPSAGVLRGLEVWGGVLGALLSLYAVAQWRCVVQRGGSYTAIVPLMAGELADALYFAALFSTLHALAAEAGSLGMTLPLANSEQHVVKAFIYSAIGFKTVRLIYVNINQCKCDIFFLDWAEYNPPLKETSTIDKPSKWRPQSLAREWSRMQTARRASPGYTAALSLLLLHFMTPWQAKVPSSQVYKWAIATLAWWAAYVSVLLAQWLKDKLWESPGALLPTVCRGVGISLLVFQEEYYAHYVDGRDDDLDSKTSALSLATCRLVCAPQLRTVYNQLTKPTLDGVGALQTDMKQALLSKFLAAFFERALDGLSWVASERTLMERLLDVEMTSRESGSTSALLYDPNEGIPSCFTLTWFGQEWSMGTFDAMVFGTVIVAGHDSLLAAFITLVTWQAMKIARQWFGDRNLRQKTGVDVKFN